MQRCNQQKRLFENSLFCLKTAYLKQRERILLHRHFALFDRLIVDGLEDGEPCSDAVVLIAALAQVQFQSFQMVEVDSF